MFPENVIWRSPRVCLALLIIGGLLLMPLLAAAAGSNFYLTFATRVVVYAIAATGLNLLLGYGGLVSMGHAMFVGLGAYVVGIGSFHGLTNGWLQLAIALSLTAIVAASTGLVVLRTRGIGFIMISLAFGQMLFFLAVALKQYGGDDGLQIETRSVFSPISPLESKVVLYYIALSVLFACMYFVWRTVHGRLGYVLRGFHSNERRMSAAGFPRLRYQLFAYVASAMICAVAGILLANLTAFVSPSYMSWQASGDLILITVLGGMSTVIGPVVGAIVLLVLEESLSEITQHWMIILGPLILLVALISEQGLWGLLMPRSSSEGTKNSDAKTGTPLLKLLRKFAR